MPYKDREKRVAYARAHYLRHLEARKAATKAWYAANSQLVIANVAAWRRKNPGKRSEEARRRKYALSAQGFHELVVLQENRCAICEEVPTGKGNMSTLRVDHDHVTGQIRGLLCHKCNVGLGAFRDNRLLVTKAALYLASQRAQESA